MNNSSIDADHSSESSVPKVQIHSDILLQAASEILADEARFDDISDVLPNVVFDTDLNYDDLQSDILFSDVTDANSDYNLHELQSVSFTDSIDQLSELQPVPFTDNNDQLSELQPVPFTDNNDRLSEQSTDQDTVQVIIIQSFAEPSTSSTLLTDDMSLDTLLEAARFLEMQEQQSRVQQQANTTTIVEAQGVVRPAAAKQVPHHHQTQHIYQNGNGLQTRTITLQPIKPGPGVTVALNTPIASPVIQQSQPQAPPTQTVVISSNNISSTLLQGPISFSQTSSPTSSPTPMSMPTAIKIEQDGHIKIEQDGHISSTTLTQAHHQRPQRTYNNSFDIVNPLVIDEGKPDQKTKLKQPPMAFRSGTREVHNKLEKHRRAHLKECFDTLKKQLMPNSEEKKTSNLSILHSALRCIQSLKRRERELEHEMERLAREKITHQQRLAVLKKDISLHYDNIDFGKLLPEVPSTATGGVSGTVAEQVSSSSMSHINILPQRMSETAEFVLKSEPSSIGATVITQNTTANGLITATNGEKVAIPILSKPVSVVTHNAPVTTVKEVSSAQPVQTTGISVLPMSYPVNPQGLVLQKVAIVPHSGLKELTPLVSTHFITTPQQLNGINGQLNGKVVPLTQYLVKPVVVVSTASPRPGS